MIGTRILKIDLEIAEIIEVKAGNHHLENLYFGISQRQKNNFHVEGATLTSIISHSSYFVVHCAARQRCTLTDRQNVAV